MIPSLGNPFTFQPWRYLAAQKVVPGLQYRPGLNPEAMTKGVKDGGLYDIGKVIEDQFE